VQLRLTKVFQKKACGCHTIYVNHAAQKSSAIPRHREINDFLARKICRDLQIPEP
jgi:hypothetical protein